MNENILITFILLGLNRQGLPFCADATYLRTCKSSDNQNNKLFFYLPYGGHVIKLMLIVSPHPKVIFS